MKVSYNWLNNFFESKLPGPDEVADALTFHAFEIEEVVPKEGDTMLDVNVLPDRACYALSYRGIAYELSAILNMPMVQDPIRGDIPNWPTTDALKLTIDTKKCNRHMGALVRGIKVGPSPEWLKRALEAIGQRSINNIVDATNLVTFNTGQPLHAFDAGKIEWNGEVLEIGVREANAGEEIQVLTGEKYKLPEGTAVICEVADGRALDIAGIKGGMASAITEDTKDIFVSVANFDGTSVRKTSQALKLWTDASLRFQNRPSPELVPYGMRQMLSLVEALAGGTLEGVVDVYPNPFFAKLEPVRVSIDTINGVLGSTYTEDQVADIFTRLQFAFEKEGSTFYVTPPFERRDIVIAEDLVEEVGRIMGYDHIPATSLPPVESFDQSRYRSIERIKDFLIERGFTEISTQSFASTGDIYLANPLDQSKPALRTTLTDNMRDALTRAALQAPRVLGPTNAVKLFEIGTVFVRDSEHLSLALGYKQLVGKQSATFFDEEISALKELLGETETTRSLDVVEISLQNLNPLFADDSYQPKKVTLGAFTPYSQYPFALRDIAVWTPAGTEEDEVRNLIVKEAGPLLARIDQFDRFEKRNANDEVERVSYAFRLVFESFERTLSDEDLNPAMEKVTGALNANEGWEVR